MAVATNLKDSLDRNNFRVIFCVWLKEILLKQKTVERNLKMKKYVLIYDDAGGNVDIRFIQSDKDFEAKGIHLGHTLWGDFVNDDLIEYLKETFDIVFEEGDTFVLKEFETSEFETI